MNIVQLVTGPLSVNTWFIPLDDRRVVVVDPGGDADIIIAHLRERHAAPALFALTHGHFDHIIAIPELLAAWPGTPIAIHKSDAHFLGAGALERHRSFFASIGGAGLIDQYGTSLPPATAFFEDGADLVSVLSSVPGASSVPESTGWRIIHTPGHSKGSICLYNEREGVLIAGDTLFNSGVGRTDAAGGNLSELERSLDLLSALPPDTVVLPGHGPKTTIGRELGGIRG